MAINNLYPATSPYYNTDIVNTKYLDVMNNRPIPATASDIYWTITSAYEYRPDLLAHDLYGDSRLWWVFAQRNPNTLTDPYFSFVSGLSIFLPKQEVLVQVLGI